MHFYLRLITNEQLSLFVHVSSIAIFTLYFSTLFSELVCQQSSLPKSDTAS